MDNVFVGEGKNPSPGVSDIPLGLGSVLSQNPGALQGYTALNDDEKNRLISYVQSGKSAQEARHKIAEAVKKLESGNMDFI